MGEAGRDNDTGLGGTLGFCILDGLGGKGGGAVLGVEDDGVIKGVVVVVGRGAAMGTVACFSMMVSIWDKHVCRVDKDAG